MPYADSVLKISVADSVALRLDCVDAQVDMELHCLQMFEGPFSDMLMSQGKIVSACVCSLIRSFTHC